MAKKIRLKCLQEAGKQKYNPNFPPAIIPGVSAICKEIFNIDVNPVGIRNLSVMLHEYEHVIHDSQFDLQNYKFNRDNTVDGLVSEMILTNLAGFADTLSEIRWSNIIFTAIEQLRLPEGQTIYYYIDELSKLKSLNKEYQKIYDKVFRRIKSSIDGSWRKKKYEKMPVTFPENGVALAIYPFDQGMSEEIREITTEAFNSVDVGRVALPYEEKLTKFYLKVLLLIRKTKDSVPYAPAEF